MQIKKLSELKIGETATILSIEPDCPIKSRLQDIGFIAGNKIVCELVSPLGEPIAYKINETLIALRNEDILKINIST